jgi:hypothetical protein
VININVSEAECTIFGRLGSQLQKQFLLHTRVRLSLSVFWNIAPCSDVEVGDDGGSTHL